MTGERPATSALACGDGIIIPPPRPMMCPSAERAGPELAFGRDSKAPAMSGAGMAKMEISKILIAYAMIILFLAISLSLTSQKRHNPDPAACDGLRAHLDWDDPAWRLLCAETGGWRGAFRRHRANRMGRWR